jgi:two-component system LytT family sensor kinase
MIMASKRYSDKELRLFAWVVLPYCFVMNLIVFGPCMFSSLRNIVLSTTLSVAYLFVAYFVFGLTASFIQRRFPSDHDLFKRIGIILPLFYILNIFLVAGLYRYYQQTNWFLCPTQERQFWWALAFGCFASTVITFLNEAAVNWSKWEKAVTETEQLKTAYQKSKLYGLKGQMNPHFLFNCFNSLSELIQEDEEKAERFLSEMTKVHRYLLRTDDEHLVNLEEELKFAQSYLFLIQARFGKAVQVAIDVQPDSTTMQLPPLSLQVILEHIIYTNVATKSRPLALSIFNEEHRLVIRHSLQHKLISSELYHEESLDNLIAKYRLLGAAAVLVEEQGKERIISLPLFNTTAA